MHPIPNLPRSTRHTCRVIALVDGVEASVSDIHPEYLCKMLAKCMVNGIYSHVFVIPA